ncbi:MAG: SDR family NAD(P)-dependent oxidoreductase, partial [Cyclobacteriaceae bacterium]|nr:SDR family NAD(P)-dependent oxidoreductase [Cyclobacteriaceae bacterium]
MPAPPKAILITGASSGLGKAIGLRLAKAGHTVLGTSRQPQFGEGHGAFPLVAMDVTSDDSVNAAIAEVI